MLLELQIAHLFIRQKKNNMNDSEVTQRLRHLYDSIEEATEWSDEDLQVQYQIDHERKRETWSWSGAGALKDERIENRARTIVMNLGSLSDKVKSYFSRTGRDPELVTKFSTSQPAIELIRRVWNNDKHRDARGPRLRNIRREMTVTSNGSEAGKVTMARHENGSYAMVGTGIGFSISGDIVDENDVVIGSLDAAISEAIAVWEPFLTSHGIQIHG
jgi:hypothetical protein